MENKSELNDKLIKVNQGIQDMIDYLSDISIIDDMISYKPLIRKHEVYNIVFVDDSIIVFSKYGEIPMSPIRSYHRGQIQVFLNYLRDKYKKIISDYLTRRLDFISNISKI